MICKCSILWVVFFTYLLDGLQHEVLYLDSPHFVRVVSYLRNNRVSHTYKDSLVFFEEFLVLAFTLRSVMHFHLIFVYDVTLPL